MVFPIRDHAHILLGLSLSNIFLGGTLIRVFLISNFKCSWLVYRKAIVFCIYTLFSATLLQLLIPEFFGQ